MNSMESLMISGHIDADAGKVVMFMIRYMNMSI